MENVVQTGFSVEKFVRFLNRSKEPDEKSVMMENFHKVLECHSSSELDIGPEEIMQLMENLSQVMGFVHHELSMTAGVIAELDRTKGVPVKKLL